MALFPLRPFSLFAPLVCRDWTTTLRRASFRGVGFFVENDSRSGGRRLVVHEFPGGDDPVVEDLGRKAQHVNVTAYVTGEALGEIEVKEQGLIEALEQDGPGQLSIPMGTFKVHCESYERAYSKDRLGYIAFNLKFVRAGENKPVLPLIGLARAIEFASGAISVATALARTYRTLGQASYVSAASALGLREFLSVFQGTARTSPIAPANMAPLLATSNDAIDNSNTITAVGSPGDSYGTTAYVGNAPVASAEPLANLITGLFQEACNGLEPADAATFCANFVGYGETPTRVTTPTMQLISTNTTAMNNAIRAAAIASYAAAVTQIEFSDVRDARQARADADEYFDAALEDMAGWENFDLWNELNALRGQVAQHLTTLIATLAPVRVVTAPARMPALYWACRLYGDYSRGDELVGRNGIKHGLFMPTEFEALSR